MASRDLAVCLLPAQTPRPAPSYLPARRAPPANRVTSNRAPISFIQMPGELTTNKKQTRSEAVAAVLLLLTTLTACAPQPQNPQELRQKTAQTTAEMKNDAKAVAQGVRDGLTRDKTIDLNSATKDQLMTLPGITAAQADRIIDNRLYDDPNDLVTKRVLPKQEYDKIADRVVVKK